MPKWDVLEQGLVLIDAKYRLIVIWTALGLLLAGALCLEASVEGTPFFQTQPIGRYLYCTLVLFVGIFLIRMAALLTASEYAFYQQTILPPSYDARLFAISDGLMKAEAFGRQVTLVILNTAGALYVPPLRAYPYPSKSGTSAEQASSRYVEKLNVTAMESTLFLWSAVLSSQLLALSIEMLLPRLFQCLSLAHARAAAAAAADGNDKEDTKDLEERKVRSESDLELEVGVGVAGVGKEGKRDDPRSRYSTELSAIAATADRLVEMRRQRGLTGSQDDCVYECRARMNVCCQAMVECLARCMAGLFRCCDAHCCECCANMFDGCVLLVCRLLQAFTVRGLYFLQENWFLVMTLMFYGCVFGWLNPGILLVACLSLLLLALIYRLRFWLLSPSVELHYVADMILPETVTYMALLYIPLQFLALFPFIKPCAALLVTNFAASLTVCLIVLALYFDKYSLRRWLDHQFS